MTTFGVFGINNDALNTAVNVLILVLVVVWLALVFWTFADARRRIDDPMLVGCATLASLFPFVGTIVYMIVRPPEYLDDVRAARAGDAGGRGAARRSSTTSCARTASTRSRRDYLRCPSCHAQAQGALPLCGKADRPDVEAVPVLRGGDRRAPPAPTGAPAPPAAPRPRTAAAEAPPRAPSADPRPEGAPMDRTLILVKPDAFARNLTGEIIARFERKGLRIVALRLHDARPRARRAALRRARGQAVLRGARRRSSPPGRSWRWCSRATRPSRPPAR